MVLRGKGSFSLQLSLQWGQALKMSFLGIGGTRLISATIFLHSPAPALGYASVYVSTNPVWANSSTQKGVSAKLGGNWKLVGKYCLSDP